MSDFGFAMKGNRGPRSQTVRPTEMTIGAPGGGGGKGGGGFASQGQAGRKMPPPPQGGAGGQQQQRGFPSRTGGPPAAYPPQRGVGGPPAGYYAPPSGAGSGPYGAAPQYSQGPYGGPPQSPYGGAGMAGGSRPAPPPPGRWYGGGGGGGGYPAPPAPSHGGEWPAPPHASSSYGQGSGDGTPSAGPGQTPAPPSEDNVPFFSGVASSAAVAAAASMTRAQSEGGIQTPGIHIGSGGGEGRPPAEGPSHSEPVGHSDPRASAFNPDFAGQAPPIPGPLGKHMMAMAKRCEALEAKVSGLLKTVETLSTSTQWIYGLVAGSRERKVYLYESLADAATGQMKRAKFAVSGGRWLRLSLPRATTQGVRTDGWYKVMVIVSKVPQLKEFWIGEKDADGNDTFAMYDVSAPPRDQPAPARPTEVITLPLPLPASTGDEFDIRGASS